MGKIGLGTGLAQSENKKTDSDNDARYRRLKLQEAVLQVKEKTKYKAAGRLCKL